MWLVMSFVYNKNTSILSIMQTQWYADFLTSGASHSPQSVTESMDSKNQMFGVWFLDRTSL